MVAPPVLDRKQVDAIYAALLKTLVARHVMLPNATLSNEQRCLVLPTDDAAAHARMDVLAFSTLSRDGFGVDNLFFPFQFARSDANAHQD